MRLRKKFNIAGMSCFFLSVLSAVLFSFEKKKEITGLYELLTIGFLVAATIFTLIAFILKKIKHRKKRKVRHHSKANRTVMSPYIETEEFSVKEESDEVLEEETEKTEEAEQQERGYQVYTMVPKKPKGKKRKKDKGM
jgi:hypothetical protein